MFMKLENDCMINKNNTVDFEGHMLASKINLLLTFCACILSLGCEVLKI